MTDRHPALARLDVLVGRWAVQPQVDGVGAAWAEFAWTDDGWFLRYETGVDPGADMGPWEGHAPFPTIAMIGLDDADDEFTLLYADARGVHRVYRMTFADGVWRQQRDAPGFAQRFTGTLSADGDTIDAQWEMARDGESWSVDFELTFTRVR